MGSLFQLYSTTISQNTRLVLNSKTHFCNDNPECQSHPGYPEYNRWYPERFPNQAIFDVTDAVFVHRKLLLPGDRRLRAEILTHILLKKHTWHVFLDKFVNCPAVVIQVAFLRKPLVANTTLVGLLPRMDTHMILHVMAITELFPAERASKTLFLFVNYFHMTVQAATNAETLTTLGAFIGFFACMTAHMQWKTLR